MEKDSIKYDIVKQEKVSKKEKVLTKNSKMEKKEKAIIKKSKKNKISNDLSKKDIKPSELESKTDKDDSDDITEHVKLKSVHKQKTKSSESKKKRGQANLGDFFKK